MFLTTRVQSPDIDHWRKLGRCLPYLKDTKDLPLTLEANNMSIINWWVDASFAVHHDFRSHTGVSMSLGKGCAINLSSKQKINTWSSTEAELFGVDDAMALIIWVKLFMEHQGFTVTNNVISRITRALCFL